MPVRAPLILGAESGRIVARAANRVAAILVAALLLPVIEPLDIGAERTVSASPPLATGNLSAAAYVLLSRIYPNAARDDEFVEVWNRGPAPVDLGGWALTDGEGTARYPQGTWLDADGRLVATRNATSYEEDLLAPPALTWDRGDAARMEGTPLRLADAGDEVLLLNPAGETVDAFVYGDSEFAGRGWEGPPARKPARGEIAVRRPAAGDHDNASDWDAPRRYRLGQSAFDPVPVAIDGATRAVVSPDDGAGPLLAFLASARRRLDVAVYTLTSAEVGAVLADRARRGVEVRVLLEGAPVGGRDEAEERIASGLAAAGAHVRWLASGAEVVKRYAYLHAKYAIADGEGVLVTSENFGQAGFPSAGRWGNRGWTVAVQDPVLAGQLRDVFEEDFDPRRRDSVSAAADPAVDLGPVPSPGTWSWPAPTGIRTVRLLVGPDTTLDEDALLGLLEGARTRIDVEAFYLEDPWGPWPNPFVEACFRAARRGVPVRILLDGGGWHGGDGLGGNVAVAAVLNRRAGNESVPLEVRLLPGDGTLAQLHNKGAVVDRRAVLVSSVNWAMGSATENREIGLILEDPVIAARFEDAFRADWDGGSGEEGWGFLAHPAVLLGLYAAVAVASAASLRFLRQGDKGLSGRAGFNARGVRRAHLRGGHRKVRVLSSQLVAQPRPRAGRGRGDRGGGEAARDRLRGPERH